MPDPTYPICSTCPHYHQLGAEPRGECHRFPPTNERGSKWRPIVSQRERACGEHPELRGAPTTEKPTVSEKTQPATVGAALKDRRQSRR